MTQTATPPGMKEGAFIVTDTGAACPECGGPLRSVAKIQRVFPGDGGAVEVFVQEPTLTCPNDGCDTEVVSI